MFRPSVSVSEQQSENVCPELYSNQWSRTKRLIYQLIIPKPMEVP